MAHDAHPVHGAQFVLKLALQQGEEFFQAMRLLPELAHTVVRRTGKEFLQPVAQKRHRGVLALAEDVLDVGEPGLELLGAPVYVHAGASPRLEVEDGPRAGAQELDVGAQGSASRVRPGEVQPGKELLSARARLGQILPPHYGQRQIGSKSMGMS